MKDLNELRRKRGEIVAQARAILDKAEKEKRNLTAEETANYDKAMADQEALRAEIEREERQRKIELGLQTPLNDVRMPEPAPAGVPVSRRATPEYQRAFNSLLRTGPRGLNLEEERALQADVSASGGYTVVPEQFIAQLIAALNDQVAIRALATKITVDKAAALGVPSLDADPADADWTTELLTGSEDSTMAFGKRTMIPHPCAKLIKISNKLLRVSSIAIDQLVRLRMAYKFGITLEKAYMTGDGSGKPLGLFTASANGIPTSRDIVAGTTTALTGDGLIDVLYGLKSPYKALRSCRWIFSRTAMKQIRKLKTATDGQYIWLPGLQAGAVDRILDIEVIVSEYCPATFTAGLYVGMLGAIEFYWVADALDFSIQVASELYAATNQVGYFGRYEGDGAPVLAEAFARVTLAAS